MIVRMKEILLFTSSQNIDETVVQLGKLGIVDVEQIQVSEFSNSQTYQKFKNNVEKALNILQSVKQKSSSTANFELEDQTLVNRIIRAIDIRAKLVEKLSDLNQQLLWYTIWGKRVSIGDIKAFQNKGIYLKLYYLKDKQAGQLRQNHTLEFLPKFEGNIPTVLITRHPNEKLNLTEQPLPQLSYKQVQERIKRKERQISKLDGFLKHCKTLIPQLEAYLESLRDHIQIETTLEGTQTIEDKVRFLKGYIPHNQQNAFKKAAAKHGWGYQITAPQNPEKTPVYIKNPKWISIINPVMKFIDIVPGYKEVDVSIYFLIAFALFFAMLVGDAGYGLIFLIITLIFRKKLSPQTQTLILVLSTATIIWGVLSGTYFGSEQIAGIPVLNRLIVPEIASFGVNNISFMMHLSFLIGAIHLTVAHTIRMFQFINSIRALSELGWIALVWGLFLVTEQLVLGNPMPYWGIWLFIGGAALVALFSMESKGFLRSMGASLANLPLSLISGFSDIVSYVRLFAVGMATAAVAASFNNMILPEGVEGLGFIQIIIAAIALLLGHGLNIVLALMAVMVHGIRLNMLEFSGHLGVQFSGEPYRPFKINPKRMDSYKTK